MLGRTALLSSVVLAAAWLVERFTEERAAGTPSLGLLPLVPVAAAVAVAFVLRRARRSGELTALLAIGVTPWTACRGAVWAAIALSTGAGAAFAVGWGDEAALFPEAPATFDVALVEPAEHVTFRSRALAVDIVAEAGRWRLLPIEVATSGHLAPSTDRHALEQSRGATRRRRWSVALTLAAAGPTLAALSVMPPSSLIAAAVLSIYAVGQLVAFQLVGIRRLPPEALIVPVVCLFVSWWLLRARLHRRATSRRLSSPTSSVR